jgi:hypothetical protein
LYVGATKVFVRVGRHKTYGNIIWLAVCYGLIDLLIVLKIYFFNQFSNAVNLLELVTKTGIVRAYACGIALS